MAKISAVTMDQIRAERQQLVAETVREKTAGA